MFMQKEIFQLACEWFINVEVVFAYQIKEY